MADPKAQDAIRKLKKVAEGWEGPRWEVGQDNNMKDVMIEHGAYGLLEENNDRVFRDNGSVSWGLRDEPPVSQSVVDALEKEEKRMFVSENVTDNPYTSENFHYRGLRCITPCDNGKCEAMVPDYNKLVVGNVDMKNEKNLQCKEAPPEYRALAKLKHLAKMLPEMKKRTDGLVGSIRSSLETLRAAVSSDYVSPTAKGTANGEYGSDELAKWKYFQEQVNPVRDQIGKLSDPSDGADLDELNNKINAAENALQKAQEMALRDLMNKISDNKKQLVARANEKQAFASENNLEQPLPENISTSKSVKVLKKAVEAYEKKVNAAYEAQQAAFRTQISEWEKIQLNDPVSKELQAFAKTHFDKEFQWQWTTYGEEWKNLQNVIEGMSDPHISEEQYTGALRELEQIRESALTKLRANMQENSTQVLSSIAQQQKELKQKKYDIQNYEAWLGAASGTLKTLHQYNHYLTNIRRLESSKKFDVFVEYKDLLETDRENYVKTFNEEIYNAWYTKLTEKTQSSSFFEWITGTQLTTIEKLRRTDVDAAITLLEEVKANKQRLETEFVQRMHRDQEAEVQRIEETVRTLQTESGFDAVPAVDEHIQNLRQASAEVTRERKHSVTQYKHLSPEVRQFMLDVLALRPPSEGFLERNPGILGE